MFPSTMSYLCDFYLILFQSPKPEQPVMQALESLNDKLESLTKSPIIVASVFRRYFFPQNY